MLRYTRHVKWEDEVSSKVAKRCGMEDMLSALRRQGLRWYGHIRRGDDAQKGSAEHQK